MAPAALRMLSQRRAFSIIARARSLGRAVEPHPFERLPMTQLPAKADWGRQARHLGHAAMFYFPAFGILLGWPLVAEAMLDGKVK